MFFRTFLLLGLVFIGQVQSMKIRSLASIAEHFCKRRPSMVTRMFSTHRPGLATVMNGSDLFDFEKPNQDFSALKTSKNKSKIFFSSFIFLLDDVSTRSIEDAPKSVKVNAMYLRFLFIWHSVLVLARDLNIFPDRKLEINNLLEKFIKGDDVDSLLSEVWNLIFVLKMDELLLLQRHVGVCNQFRKKLLTMICVVKSEELDSEEIFEFENHCLMHFFYLTKRLVEIKSTQHLAPFRESRSFGNSHLGF